MNRKLIAPCGMNCNLCMAYLREKNKCPGCRMIRKETQKYIRKCPIKNCQQLKNNNWVYCSKNCENFPCQRLKSLDKRYKTKYCMSMLENLDFIKNKGIRNFIKHEEKRWIKGNKIFCVHKKRYFVETGGKK